MATYKPENFADMNVQPPANRPLGAGTPLEGLLDQDIYNQAQAIDPFYNAGQALGINPPDAPGMPEIDVTNIQPLNPDGTNPNFAPDSPDFAAEAQSGYTPPSGATENDKLAAARAILGTEEPKMVDKVVGKTTTSSSSQTQSEASKAASAELERAQAAAQKATAMELQGARDQAMIEAEISEKDNKAISTIESARAAVQMEKQQEFQKAINDIDTRVAELANFKPETFWGSKTASDKITAALSVGLGAFGASMLGSGQNIGQVLLERNMNEFDRNQQLQYQSKLKQIDAMKGSLDMKRSLALEAEKTFDAQKLAARAQIQAQNAKALAMAKTPQVQAGIMQRQAKMDADIAKAQAEVAARYETKLNTTTENDILKKIPQVAGLTKTGQPLNVEQSKAVGFYSQMSQSAKNIAKFDEQALVKRGSVGDYMRDVEYNAQSSDIPLIGKGLGAIRTAMKDTAEDRVAKADPEAYNYVQQAQGFVNALLRKESGASIADPEFQRTFKQYFPQANDGPQEVKEKAERRQQAIKDMYLSTGM